MSRSKIFLAAAATLVVGLAGCTSEVSSHGSRVALYDSLQELAADSSLVVVGSVQASQETNDLSGLGSFTLADFIVDDVVSPEFTGSALPAEVLTPTVQTGETITVRQMGDADEAAPAAFLSEGERYMLFLTPTMLAGPAADDFYITGVTAGMYVAIPATVSRDRPGGAFEHHDSRYGGVGDNLPSELSPADLAALE